MPLYEVAILEKPTKNEAEDGKMERLVYGPVTVVARDPMSAGIAAVKGGDVPKFDDGRSEVLVRPFA